MLSKVITGRSFYSCCQYICKDQNRAVVLHTDGVRGHDYRLMTEDFLLQQQLRPSKKQACFHGILSFYPGEKLSDEKLVEIAQNYLRQMGITNTQYAITKHTDKPHLHLHIVANLVNNQGSVIKDNWIGLKGKKVAQQLTQQYGLTPALEKNLALIHLESLSEKEVNRYKVYAAIQEGLRYSRSIGDLEKHLLHYGITTLYKYKRGTSELQGISFQVGANCFKGSQVDRRFSIGNLQKTFAYNATQKLYQGSRWTAQPGLEEQKAKRDLSTHQSHDKDTDIQRGKTISKALENLLKPEQYPDSLPSELLKENREKRKRQSHNRGRHL